jgi:GNAT superfamily N-acetyltransferase
LTINAWPALQTLHLDGWVLRFARGYTRRANSVQPLYPNQGDLEANLAQAEAHYAQRGLPTIFKLTTAAEPARLEAALAARGYAEDARTSMQLLDLHTPAPVAPGVTHITEGIREDWLAAFYALADTPARHQPTLRQMLGLLTPQTAFATLAVDGQVVACGLAVLEAGHVGLFDIVTHPAHRNQGHARRMIQDLLAWARGAGAHTGYLQVMLNNSPALKLYAGLGYREAYQYWYRIHVS